MPRFFIATARPMVSMDWLSSHFVPTIPVWIDCAEDVVGFFTCRLRGQVGMHWDLQVRRDGNQQSHLSEVFLPGAVEDDLPKVLRQMDGDCVFLMDEKDFARFEEACKKAGVEVVGVHHFCGLVKTAPHPGIHAF